MYKRQTQLTGDTVLLQQYKNQIRELQQKLAELQLSETDEQTNSIIEQLRTEKEQVREAPRVSLSFAEVSS